MSTLEQFAIHCGAAAGLCNGGGGGTGVWTAGDTDTISIGPIKACTHSMWVHILAAPITNTRMGNGMMTLSFDRLGGLLLYVYKCNCP